jgi:hypothetical protein
LYGPGSVELGGSALFADQEIGVPGVPRRSTPDERRRAAFPYKEKTGARFAAALRFT